MEKASGLTKISGLPREENGTFASYSNLSKKKIGVYLPVEIDLKLRKLAEKQHLTPTELLRQIAIEKLA